jgi:hypothetical protein
MNRKSDRALAILRATRTADVSNELRNPRLLLEARALSDLGRHDLALEVAANLEGREAIRLRSDILWAGRRWRESGEQIEILYGDRFTQWQPLSDVERTDILRAAIGYALGEDALGLARFREKYAAKMAATPDARAFEIVSAPLGASGAEFRDIAHAAARSTPSKDSCAKCRSTTRTQARPRHPRLPSMGKPPMHRQPLRRHPHRRHRQREPRDAARSVERNQKPESEAGKAPAPEFRLLKVCCL